MKLKRNQVFGALIFGMLGVNCAVAGPTIEFGENK
jgi:hypothetical protein